MNHKVWAPVAAALALITLPATPATAGKHQNAAVNGAPVGKPDCNDCKTGEYGNFSVAALYDLKWSDNFSSVTLEKGTSSADYCSPSDCLEDGNPSGGAKNLIIETKLIIRGKKISYSESASGGSEGFTYTYTRSVEGEEIKFEATDEYPGKAGADRRFFGLKVDGTDIYQVLYLVRGTVDPPRGDRTTVETTARTELQKRDKGLK